MKYSVIPKPVRYDIRNDTVEISSNTAIICAKELKSSGDYLAEYLHTVQNASDGAIRIDHAKSISPEGYAIYTENGDIVIKASTNTGAFYAIITLKWILMQVKNIDGKKTVNGFLIEDKPCYKHRGMMLDECRHFFGIDTVKKLLDNMAMLKMNVFHWHLSDDQGYRIESRAFPKLNEISSKREFAGLKGLGQKHYGGEYGPFYYTFDQIREIVSYANSLHIEVIPEINVPGHCTAIVAAYPEICCNGKNVNVAVTNGILKQTMCAGSDFTFEFLSKIFDEICPLFSSRRIHIGGDETRYSLWKACPKCQGVMEENKIKSEKQLQVYFMNKVSQMLKQHGKTCIVWNDCVSDELDSSIMCQYWNPMINSGVIKKQAKNRYIILSPMSNFYFDFKYSKLPLDRVYKYNSKGFNKKGMKIAGVESEVWTEWIDGDDALEYSVYPRIAATAEVGWNKKDNRKIKDFNRRMKFYYMYLNSKGINYCRLKKPIISSSLKGWYSFGANGKEFKKNEKLKKAAK